MQTHAKFRHCLWTAPMRLHLAPITSEIVADLGFLRTTKVVFAIKTYSRFEF